MNFDSEFSILFSGFHTDDNFQYVMGRQWSRSQQRKTFVIATLFLCVVLIVVAVFHLSISHLFVYASLLQRARTVTPEQFGVKSDDISSDDIQRHNTKTCKCHWRILDINLTLFFSIPIHSRWSNSSPFVCGFSLTRCFLESELCRLYSLLRLQTLHPWENKWLFALLDQLKQPKTIGTKNRKVLRRHNVSLNCKNA